MAKRPSNQDTLQLSLELLRRIPKGRRITAKELHQQLQTAGIERDIRTIQRQLDLLSVQFDIERDERSKPYGYRWRQNAQSLSIPGLSQQESLLLNLAEQQLRNLLPANLLKSMAGFFEQAKRNLDGYTITHPARDWLAKVRVVDTTQPLLPPALADGVLAAVSDALYDNLWLDIRYQNAAGKLTEARVMPLGLAQQGVRLYLVCRFQSFDDNRNLALHRLLWAQASTLNFDRPKDFSLANYDNDGQFGWGKGERIRLSFKSTKNVGLYLIETPLSEDQQVEELDDCYQITATVVDSGQLEWWLRSFGGQIFDIAKITLDCHFEKVPHL